MNTLNAVLYIRKIVLVAPLAWMAWLPALPIQAVEMLPGDVSSSVAMRGLGSAASGAVEDTLKACLDRIPKDASPGQRMMAELSCDRDEDGRKLMQAVPSR